jgi:hypothetical protein
MPLFPYLGLENRDVLTDLSWRSHFARHAYFLFAVHVSLSRLNHRLPRGEVHSEVVQDATDLHHQIADTLLPQADPVFDDTAPFDIAIAMLNP